MKLQSLATTLVAATALVGGSAYAQATMQPIPNPPEKAASHKHMTKHHSKAHHAKAPMAKDTAPAAAPAPQ